MSFILDHNKLNKWSGSKRGILDLVLQHFLFSTAFSIVTTKVLQVITYYMWNHHRENNHSQISTMESHQGKVPPFTSQNLCLVQILIAFPLWLLGSDPALAPLKTPRKKELTVQLQETSTQFWKLGIGKVKQLAFQNILLKHQFLFHEGS